MNWQVHDENVTVLGMQSSGKTTLARSLLAGIPGVARLIISPQNPQLHYGQYGQPIADPEEIAEGRAMLWTGATDKSTFERICDAVMRCNNLLMVVDDAHEFASKQKIPEAWATLINSGRNRGITSIFISPAPNLLNNILMQSSSLLCSFRFTLATQIEYARDNFFGESAYLLMPPMSRPPRYRNLAVLDKHAYLSRHVSETYIELHGADGTVRRLEAPEDATDAGE